MAAPEGEGMANGRASEAAARLQVMEALVRTAGSRRSGVPFLNAAVGELARALEIPLVFVGELVEDGAARVRAIEHGDLPVAGAEYRVANTPCERLLDGRPVVLASGVAQAYPHDRHVQHLGLQAYAGIPLLGDDDAVIGVLVAADTRPFAHPEQVLDALTVVGDRVAVELERERSAQARARADAHLAAVFDTEHLGVALTSLSGRWLDVNAALCALLEAPRAVLLSQGLPAFLVDPDPALAHAQWLKLVSGERESFVLEEAHLRRPSGEVVVAQTSVQRRRSPAAGDFAVVFVRDLSAQREAKARIQRLRSKDRLTGLPNRHHFLVQLAEAGDRAGHSPAAGLAVHLVDLDHFHDINDGLGHRVGDALLVEVARRIQACLGPEYPLARLGSDEFGVLQPGLARAEQAVALAERILAAVRAPWRIDGRSLMPSVSVGVATALTPDGTGSPSALMEHADMALAEAKRRRGSYALHTQSLGRAVRARIELGDALRAALDGEGGLSVHFQPVVTLEGRTVVGAEALCRWTHPRLGAVSPGDFIKVAEARGLIHPLGAWVLSEACAQLAVWRQIQPDFWVSVNASPEEFLARDFVARVRASLALAGVTGDGLVIELTEGVLARDVALVTERMRALRADGVRFAIDDFGTGFSSLLYLKRLPVATLKVAQEFVRDMLTDPGDAEIVRATLSLARAFELQVIAEGVEDQGQAARLWGEGCRLAQGFRFARPMVPEGVTALLRRGDPLASASAVPALRTEPLTSPPG